MIRARPVHDENALQAQAQLASSKLTSSSSSSSTTMHRAPLMNVTKPTASTTLSSKGAAGGAPRRALGDISNSNKQQQSASSQQHPLKITSKQQLTTTLKPTPLQPKQSNAIKQAAPKQKQPAPSTAAPAPLALPSLGSFDASDDDDAFTPLETTLHGSGAMPSFRDEEVEYGLAKMKQNPLKPSQMFTLQRPASPIMWSQQHASSSSSSSSSIDLSSSVHQMTEEEKTQEAILLSQLNGGFDLDSCFDDDFNMTHF